jgi:hypothetical protein
MDANSSYHSAPFEVLPCSVRVEHSPLQPCSQCFKLLLLLRDGPSQFVHGTVLFEKLVEQHRVDRIKAHGIDLTVFVAYHEVRIHFGDFLSD